MDDHQKALTFAVLAAVVSAGGYVFAMYSAQQAGAEGPPGWMLPAIMIGLPVIVYARMRLGFAAQRRQKHAWQNMGNGSKAIFAVVVVIAMVGSIAFAYSQVQDADRLGQEAADCVPESLDAGSSESNFAGPEETADPTGLILTSQGDTTADSNVNTTTPFGRVAFTGSWGVDVQQISLKVHREGAWYHEGTVKQPVRGQEYHLDMDGRGPYDQLRWAVTLQDSATEDTSVTVAWQTYSC